MSIVICKKFERLLSRHLDGETTAEEAEKVRAHLNSCSACEQSFRAQQRDSFLLQQYYDGLAASEGSGERIMERMNLEQARQLIGDARRPLRLRWLSAVAALLALVMAGQWMLRTDTPQWDEGLMTLIRPPVMRRLPGTETWSQLRGAGYLLPGGALRIQQGGMVRVGFHGANNILLNENTLFRLNESGNSSANIFRLSRGELFIDFALSHDPFVIHTPVADVSGKKSAVNIKISLGKLVGGLNFPWVEDDAPLSLSYLPNLFQSAYGATGEVTMQVTTRTGSVTVSNQRGSVQVFAGTQISVDSRVIQTRPGVANLSEILSWTKYQGSKNESQSPDVVFVETESEMSQSSDELGVVEREEMIVKTLGESETVQTVVESPKLIELLPPIIVEAIPEIGRISLKWMDDASTTHKVLGYDVYRIVVSSENAAQRLNERPVPVTVFENASTGGVYNDDSVIADITYEYLVYALASTKPEGEEEPLSVRMGLLESPPSAPIRVAAKRDFKIHLTGWMEQPRLSAQILVQKFHRKSGRYVGEYFTVATGDRIGEKRKKKVGPVSSPDFIGVIDFTTGYTLIDLRQERRTVFGGNTTDTGTPQPLRLRTVIAILEDSNGELLELSRQRR